MTNQVILKKVTAKAVLGSMADIRKALRDGGENARLSFDLFGIVTGAIAKDTEYGESLGFTGDFYAVNKQTGETFRAGTAYLPKAAEHVLGAAVLNAGENSKIEVALNIAVRANDESNTGYVYEVSTMLAQTAEDPVLMLKNRVEENVLLEAPVESQETKNDAQETKKTKK